MVAPFTQSTLDSGSEQIAALTTQIGELRRRVEILEARLAIAPSSVSPAIPKAQFTPTSPTAQIEASVRAVPIIGRMLIAIAGAYVLRALTEWGTIPAGIGVSLGLLYGIIWLWVAARSPAESRFPAAIYSSASVLIFAPLIWEASERLTILTSTASAACIAGFALLGLALGAKSGRGLIGTIACVCSVLLALDLMFSRHDILPFATALLVIAAGNELAAWRDAPSGSRAFAAMAADVVVLIFAFLVSPTHAMPQFWIAAPPYALLGAQIAIAVIYIATALVQSVVRRQTLGFGEILQTATALLIGIGGAVWIFSSYKGMMLALGGIALAGGVASYALSFVLFERVNKWNFRAWTTFGLFLALAGLYLPFSLASFWVLCCASAVVCCWVAKRLSLPTLGLHGAAYLALGSAAAGATLLPMQALFDIGNGAVNWAASLVVLTAAAVAWVAILRSPAEGSGQRRTRISSTVLLGHLIWIVAGLVVSGFAALWRGAPLDTVGTLILVGLSVGFALAAARGQRAEYRWLIYGVMALAAYKLVVRDLRNEHSIALVVSLLSYGGALMFLPRVLRGAPQSSAS
jgi:hypothetical protein